MDNKYKILGIIGIIIGILCFVFSVIIYNETKIEGWPLGTCVIDGKAGINPTIEDKLDCIIYQEEKNIEANGRFSTFIFIIIGLVIILSSVKMMIIQKNNYIK